MVIDWFNYYSALEALEYDNRITDKKKKQLKKLNEWYINEANKTVNWLRGD